jgi:hypothetical protein
MEFLARRPLNLAGLDGKRVQRCTLTVIVYDSKGRDHRYKKTVDLVYRVPAWKSSTEKWRWIRPDPEEQLTESALEPPFEAPSECPCMNKQDVTSKAWR